MDELPKRKNTRLKGFNYSSVGCYFITICVKDKRDMLGRVVVGAASGRPDAPPSQPRMELSRYGKITKSWICGISEKYPDVTIENHVIMPNHIHMILSIKEAGAQSGMGNGRPDAAPTAAVGRIIGYFKYQTTKEIDINGFWQRSYHDHIIRNEQEYHKIWNYVDENPIRWATDCYFVENTLDPQ